MSTKLPLENISVLITRPESLANSLKQLITKAGGTAILYPVIKITPIDDSLSLRSITDNLSKFDIAIFISPTAVSITLEKIKSLPENLKLAVIGSSTETMLKKYGYQAQIIPAEFTTESLLQHLSFQQPNVATKEIIIFRGEGGRELLGNTLIQRGANITYAETYRREKNQLGSLNHDQLNHIDVLTVTSNEGLQNLFDLTDSESKTMLINLPLIVPGDRAHRLATQLGFKKIIQASNATDDACIQAISSLIV
ncbi:MAG: uroporphyrinogen-III synthase [Gammaproteobacteria bacterium]|nr:uroporphyrinogen-III synthase [Gammaproteobacteria bacterium]